MCGILMVAQRAFQPFLAMLLPWTAGTWSFITRLLNYASTHLHNESKQSRHTEINVLQSSPPSLGNDKQIIPHSAGHQEPPRSQLRIRYVPVPGEWQRKLHPNWPDSAFRIPDQVPDGHIYYITKGDYIRRGATALVERLPSGHIAKTPLPNPYDPDGERKARQNMEHEYNVYCFIGPCQFIPKLIDWDSKCKTLVLEDHVNGDLETFLTANCDTDVNTRQRWALQAAQALASLHNIGVIHQDVTPRNFLLDKNMNLRICDFAGSSFPGHPVTTGAPGPRYQSRAWGREYVPTQADDIFSLGSVLYFIMSGEEPYSKLDEDEVKRRFEILDFPTSDYFGHGAAIQNCWCGQFINAEQVVQALVHVRG